MQRKLATIQQVDNIEPIPGADLIEVATIKGWKVVVAKGDFNIGDLAIYCEIDSFLPIKPEFEFLRKSSYKKMGDLEGFRLKTIKLRKQISQGLLLKYTIPLSTPTFLVEPCQVGDDVTEALGIIKYEPPIPAELSGVIKGNFPSFIPKTDEERIQNLSEAYNNFKSSSFYVTEKLDGSSATFYFNQGEFGVCSRNIDLMESETNSFWKVAKASNIEDFLKATGKNIAIQGELIGEGIQGNPYKLKGQDVYFFNAFDIDKQEYFSIEEMFVLFTGHLNMVPFVHYGYILPDTIDELITYADGKSSLNIHTNQEGIVVRNDNRSISFKVISNNFLLKEKE